MERVGPTGRIHGVDFAPTMMRRAAARFKREIANGRLQLDAGSITQLPLGDGSLQSAITINTIYFISELDRAFSELARVIGRSGKIVVGIGDPQMMARMPTTPFGFMIRPVDEVIAVAKSAGLAIQDHRRVGQGDEASHLLVFAPGS